MSVVVVPRGQAKPCPRALHKFAVTTACCTFLLLCAGAMVKSTGSGLSVPDWPLSFGMLMPPMKGGVFYEHGHRMIATFVGCLTTILSLWLVHSEQRRWVRRVGIAAMAAVVAQGLLGGLTVLLKLPPIVSICHAGMAEIFFALTISLALFTTPGFSTADHWIQAGGRLPASLRQHCVVTSLLVYVQIIIGAFVRHFGAGLSIPDFPLAYGRLIPPMDSIYIAIHFAHRVGALVVTIAVLTLVYRILSRERAPVAMVRVALAISGVLAVQLTLGAFIIWTGRAVEMTAAHVAFGALTFGCSVMLSIFAHRPGVLEAEAAPMPATAEVFA